MRPFLGSSVLVGLMSGMTQNGVNLISAPLLAREAGIRVTCVEQEPQSASRTVTVTVERDGRTHSATGESSPATGPARPVDNVPGLPGRPLPAWLAGLVRGDAGAKGRAGDPVGLESGKSVGWKISSFLCTYCILLCEIFR